MKTAELHRKASDAHMDRHGHPLVSDAMGACSRCKRIQRARWQATRMCVRCNRSVNAGSAEEIRYVMHKPYHYPDCP